MSAKMNKTADHELNRHTGLSNNVVHETALQQRIQRQQPQQPRNNNFNGNTNNISEHQVFLSSNNKITDTEDEDSENEPLQPIVRRQISEKQSKKKILIL